MNAINYPARDAGALSPSGYHAHRACITPDEILGQIIHADCLETLMRLPDNSIDLILTDPPYGLNIARDFGTQSGKQHGTMRAPKTAFTAKDWDAAPPKKMIFDQILRVSKHQIIFGGNYFNLPPSSCWVVWDKQNEGKTFADCELAWTSFDRAVRKFEFRWDGMLQGDMKNKETRVHPTQKPRQLFEWCIRNFAQPDWVVCDPFAGSGTTALACHNTGNPWICIEKDNEYVEIATARLAEHQAQLRLI